MKSSTLDLKHLRFLLSLVIASKESSRSLHRVGFEGGFPGFWCEPVGKESESGDL